MSEVQGTRAERMARYKEERRKQLASQFAPLSEPQGSPRRRPNKDTSSSSEEPRTTKASRLRAAASAQEASGSLASRIDKEKSPASLSNGADSLRSNKVERDKSSKRKSNLNRALTSEEVPEVDADDAVTRRRRRRFFPPEVLQQATNDASDENPKSDTLTASSAISNTALPTARTTPKKSELSIHMENARRGLVPYSNMGKFTKASPKKIKEKSPKGSPDLDHNSHSDSSNSSKLANKENIKQRTPSKEKKLMTPDIDQPVAKQRRSSNVARRMDELTALTHETLARVERLTTKSRDSPKREVKPASSIRLRPASESPVKESVKLETKVEPKSDSRVPLICDSGKPQTHSILKKRTDETYSDVVPTVIHSPPVSAPVSILKRKVSQDEFRIQGATSSTSTPPVTFSPSVIDHSTSKKKQGILKKRRSLDEAQVLRHRSCSPEGGFSIKSDSRSILKNQRRSSLEEIVRTQSPESGLQGILKRRTSRHEDEVDPPINSPEPQGILKRRSGTSSVGSNVNSPHVSIATAVILAAARGAEIILEPNELVRPILKKKSFSDDQPSGDNSITEVPKPILKKKSSTDTEDYEDRPKPILKNHRASLEERECNGSDSLYFSSYKYSYQKLEDSECEVKPILKQSTSRENSPRPRLSFYGDEDFSSNITFRHQGRTRRSHTICTEYDVNTTFDSAESEQQDEQKQRPMSVCDMVLNIEKRLSTGAIPKRSTQKRHSERYRTQPVTYDELEASRSSVHSSFQQDLPSPTLSLSSPILPSSDNHNAYSLLDLSSFDTENNLSGIFSGSLPNTTLDNSMSGKMSSDSAFQSLGDGLELENEDKPSSPSPPKPFSNKIEPAKLQMKALAEEAKNLQLRKGGLKLKSRKGIDAERPSSSRFSTQPITVDEVEEAARLKKDIDTDVDTDRRSDERDPSRLSLSERIKLFSTRTAEDKPQKPKSRLTRFQTQPVTFEEVESARDTSNRKQSIFVLDGKDATHKERKGILKSTSGAPQPHNSPSKFNDPPKSVLKKRDSFKQESPSSGLRSILKIETSDFTRDEGISSDESTSGSDPENGIKLTNFGSDKEADYLPISARLAKIASEVQRDKCNDRNDKRSSSDDGAQTSDGDSSGGREVRQIIGGGLFPRKYLRDKTSNEGLILKSKSQALIRDEEDFQSGGVRRSLTQATMPKSIAELQAKLQKSGDSDWRKRIPKLNNANEELSLLSVKNIYNEELSEKTSILAARKDELDAASKQWKSRVEQSDAVNFSVAGRMQQTNDVPTIPINIPTPDKTRRTPKAKTFRGKEGGDTNIETTSTPVSPEKGITSTFKRSISLPGSGDDSSSTGSEVSLKASSRQVQIERPDNITFTSFFKAVDSKKKSDAMEVSVHDFDSVVRQTGDLLVQKRTVRVQRRREASRNPVKALAARPDIKDEYTEIITGVAEREKQRLNIEKLAKSSNYAVEALAGLASKEDFTSVALKRSSSLNSTFPPFKDLMLMQIKGRRFVQTRLVEPVVSSINEGDCFILVTSDVVYNYIGAYANIIEQSRASDIVNSIQQTGDLGCKVDKVVTINSKKMVSASADVAKFWKLLGSTKGSEVAAAGHPDEDEVYETSILSTNMIYEYKNEQLVPVETYWGSVPKIEILSPLKTFVLDFGSEMYIWSGKNALLDDKKKALKLARELWNEGYNYVDCGVSPLDIASVLGSRQTESPALKDNLRPKWALFAKLTQHRETVLFKEKFLDWPDYSRVIRVKQDDSDKNLEAKFDFKPCDVAKMLQKNEIQPDLQIDGVHLGRGDSYFDNETNRLFNFTTKSVTSWVILEYTHEKLSDNSMGQLHEGNSYIIRWEYCANITGRELSGRPSKYVQAGRDHCVYFCWQGRDAPINEKGAAALLTVTLDSENARQIRVSQGSEQPAFLNLFQGGLVIHSGKREKPNLTSCKLYICRNEVETETFLTEVPSSMRSLRSRACFVLTNSKTNDVIVWNGCKASTTSRKVAKTAAEKIVDNQPNEFNFTDSKSKLSTVEEGSESKEFLSALGGEKRQLYLSLFKDLHSYSYTPRLFHLSSISGSFEATEILCSYRNEHTTSYPFLQSDLYSASQPALFLLDNEHEVWLWQGWWPEVETELNLADQTGSGAVRWQEERKAAMQTAVNYCKLSSEDHKPASLVWAGLEPLAFTNLFSMWRDRDDITELNIQEGKKAGEAISVEQELALLTRSTYPLEQLLQRPLPNGVDPTHLENYLSPEDFSKLMSMTLEEFQKMPTWKQSAVKKEKGLF